MKTSQVIISSNLKWTVPVLVCLFCITLSSKSFAQTTDVPVSTNAVATVALSPQAQLETLQKQLYYANLEDPSKATPESTDANPQTYGELVKSLMQKIDDLQTKIKQDENNPPVLKPVQVDTGVPEPQPK